MDFYCVAMWMTMILLANPREPGDEAGDVVINEIMYRPLRQELREKFDAVNEGFYNEQGDDKQGEYVELFNRGTSRVDLSGWAFTEGIRYTFTAGTYLEPNEYLVVAADPNTVKARFGLTRVAGPFRGSLADGGESLVLCDAAHRVADTVRYDDAFPWPIAPDEFGYALECINPWADNDSPANWRSSRTDLRHEGVPVPWQFFSVTGIATSNILYIYANGASRWLIDDIQISGIADDAVNGFFENGDDGWEKAGNHAGTFHNASEGYSSSSCEELVATAAGTSSKDSFRQTINGMMEGQAYTISGRVAYVEGNEAITVCLSRSDSRNGIYIVVPRQTVGGVWDLARDFNGATNGFNVTLPNGNRGTWTYLDRNGDPYTHAVTNNYPQELPTPSIGWNMASPPWISLNRFGPGTDGVAQGKTTNFVAGEVGGHSTTAARWTTSYGGAFRITAHGYNGRIANLGRYNILNVVDPVSGVHHATIDPVLNNGRDRSAGLSYAVDLPPGAPVTATISGEDWVGLKFTITEELGEVDCLAPPLGGFVGRGTPGRPNSVFAPSVPPLIANPAHFPTMPSSGDDVTVTAQVASDSPIVSVLLNVSLNSEATCVAMSMFDDGAHGDGAPDDGVYGVVVPAKSSQTLVHYRIYATDSLHQSTVFPYQGDPAWTCAYYHYDGELDDGGVFYHLFITQPSIGTLVAGVPSNSEEEVDCSLVIDHVAYPHIKAAFRGRRSRGAAPYHWKFRFNKNQLYSGISHLDTMFSSPEVQEYVCRAYDAVGLGNLDHELIHLYLNNGRTNGFWADYVVVASPNSSWLKKHNYSDASEIYKCRSVESSNPRRNSDLFFFGNVGNEVADNGLQTDTNYWGVYNKKMRSLESPEHIRDLVYNLNTLTDDALLPWLDAHVDMENMLTVWAMHVYLRCDDFPGHNNYLFLPDGFAGKWRMLSYDFDSFGRLKVLKPFYGSGLDDGDNNGKTDSQNWQRNKFYQRVENNPTLHRIYLLTLRQLLMDYPPEVLFPASMADLRDTVVGAERTYLFQVLAAENLPGSDKTPTVDPAGGTFAGSVWVTMAAAADWKAYYTLDGTDPRLSPTRQVYGGPFLLTQTAIVKAAAARDRVPLSAGEWSDLRKCHFVIE